MTTKTKRLWPFVSVYRESGDNEISVAYWWAEDDEHAKEQFKDSMDYNDVELIGVFYIPFGFIKAGMKNDNY